MATFRDAPATWDGASEVHVVWNSVYERSSKFARCGEKIGANARYDRDLVATCRACLRNMIRLDLTS